MASTGRRRPSPRIADLLRQISHTRDGVFAVDNDRRIIFWSRAAQSLLGHSSRDVLGKACQDVVQGRDCRGRACCAENCLHLERARKSRWLPSTDMQAKAREGHDIWINVTFIALLDRQQEFSGLAHIFRGTTQPHDEKDTPPHRADPSGLPMTPREHNVLRLLAYGRSVDAIANELSISSATVRNHIQNILRKLQVHNRVQAVALAYERHWV